MNSMKVAAKRKKRQQKVAAKRKKQEYARQERRYQQTYPEFVFEPNGAPPAFVAAVQEAVATLDFDDGSVFAKWERLVYREIRRAGWRSAQGLFAALEKAGHQQATVALIAIHGHLGQEIFNRLPEPVLLQHIPINDVQFLPDGTAIRVIFRSLLRAKGQNGTVYYSRHRPTVLVGGEKKVVALGEAFALFDQCQEFEVCNLYGGQIGSTFFENCAKGFWNELVAQEILGADFREGQDHAVRVGYCPAAVEGEFGTGQE